MNWLDIEKMKLDQLEFIKIYKNKEYLITFLNQDEIIDFAKENNLELKYCNHGYESTMNFIAISILNNKIIKLHEIYDDRYINKTVNCNLDFTLFKEKYKMLDVSIVDYKFIDCM